MATRLTSTPKDKSLRALYASVKGSMNYVSSSTPQYTGISDVSLSGIIEDENFVIGQNTTVGNDESLFRQFHAWVSGSTLFNTDTNSTANNWTHSLASGTNSYDPYVTMSIQTHTPTRFFSHVARNDWFEHQQGGQFLGLLSLNFDSSTAGGNYYFDIPDNRFPTTEADAESYYNTQVSAFAVNDYGGYRISWADPYNFTDQSNGDYTINNGVIIQQAFWTVYKSGGSGGSG
tara:strand:+ start:858 stop:1553 length:696 start_codon:yes stop_codon:yes gene_type:complete